jgi:hypothetical protein
MQPLTIPQTEPNMSMLKHTPERLLFTALVATLVCWAWNMRMATVNPLGPNWDWAVSLPAMLALSLAGCVLVSLIWAPAASARTGGKRDMSLEEI